MNSIGQEQSVKNFGLAWRHLLCSQLHLKINAVSYQVHRGDLRALILKKKDVVCYDNL